MESECIGNAKTSGGGGRGGYLGTAKLVLHQHITVTVCHAKHDEDKDRSIGRAGQFQRILLQTRLLAKLTAIRTLFDLISGLQHITTDSLSCSCCAIIALSAI